MIHPTDNTAARPLAVRDGQGAPVTCATCGCRLETLDDGTYLHFGRLGGRDARGCRIDCAETEHDALGRPLALLPA
jgi:hypothetical protein